MIEIRLGEIIEIIAGQPIEESFLKDTIKQRIQTAENATENK